MNSRETSAAKTDIAAVRSAILHRNRRWNQNKPWILMFTPVVIFFLVFKYVPMLGLLIAFKEYTFADGILGSPWVGLDNYKYLLHNPQTVNIIRNTLLLSSLQVFAGFPVPILLAILLNEIRIVWFKRWLQTLFYLPYFLNWVVVGGFVLVVFAIEAGIVNHWLMLLAGIKYPFLFNETSWIMIFVGAAIWKSAGWSAIIYLAVISTIDTSLYEAAAMDGASKRRQIWHITLPGLLPTIVLMFILNIGNVMDVGFDQVYVLQNSVVAGVAEVVSTWSYKVGLGKGEFSYSSAMGLFESLIGLILVVIANRIARAFNRGLW